MRHGGFGALHLFIAKINEQNMFVWILAEKDLTVLIGIRSRDLSTGRRDLLGSLRSKTGSIARFGHGFFGNLSPIANREALQDP